MQRGYLIPILFFISLLSTTLSFFSRKVGCLVNLPPRNINNMNSSPDIPQSTFPSTYHPVSKTKWAISLFLGIVLFLFTLLISEFIPLTLFGLPLVGITFAIIGVIRLLLGSAVVALSLKLVHLSLRDVGLTSVQWPNDFLIGAGIALIFALLQFFIIIPNNRRSHS